MLPHRSPVYACVLLIACLVFNIAYFNNVRESFLGEEDPTASIKSAIFQSGIPAKVAKLYSTTQTEEDENQNVTPHTPSKGEKTSPKAEQPTSREQRRQTSTPPTKPEEVVAIPISDPQPKIEQEPKEESKKESNPSASAVVPVETLQTAALVPVPSPAVAQSVIADQFKPIVPEQKPAVPIKPVKLSSAPVWETADTILAQPIRYD